LAATPDPPSAHTSSDLDGYKSEAFTQTDSLSLYEIARFQCDQKIDKKFAQFLEKLTQKMPKYKHQSLETQRHRHQTKYETLKYLQV
jgi:hypothetical protein